MPKMTFAQKWPQCWLCPSTFAVETHHIARGANGRPNDECNLIRVCFRCHRKVETYPIAHQIALVAYNNPDAYDRQRVNLLRNRSQDAVTESQVKRYLKRITKQAGQLLAAP